MKSKILRNWLYPGLGLKRWAILGGVGVGIIVVGLWNMINNQLAKSFIYSLFRFLNKSLPNLSFYQGLACTLVGLVFILWCFAKSVNQYMQMTYGKTGFEDYYKNTTRSQGLKVVTIGGGTGSSVLLKGLKNYTSNITAAVSVADDGGSTGRLREEFGLIPVGDIRNCIVALSDDESRMETLLNYRFNSGEGLKGHTLGNLLLLSLTNLTGNFQDAISNIDDILHISGKVLPITNIPLILEANFSSGRTVRGESYITQINEPIVKLNVLPQNARILSEVKEAIQDADVIILGPGSLYTSVIPNLCVRGVREALESTQASIVYVCNVMTQKGETIGYTASDHLKAIINHSFDNIIDYIVVDNGQCDIDENFHPVEVDELEIKKLGVKVFKNNVTSLDEPHLHDSDALARTLILGLYKDREFRKRIGLFKSYWAIKKIKNFISVEDK